MGWVEVVSWACSAAWAEVQCRGRCADRKPLEMLVSRASWLRAPELLLSESLGICLKVMCLSVNTEVC